MKNFRLKFFIISFLAFAFIMSFLSRHFSCIASKMLSMTGELQLYSEAHDEDDSSEDGTLSPHLSQIALAKQAPKNVPTQQRIDYSKQVLETGLPKTEKPVVALLRNDDFESQLDIMSAFPEMRLFTGEKWDKEKTDIYAATDGRTLYFRIICHDSAPDQLTTEFSISEGANSAWKDDSVEIFLMKDNLAENYFQFVASASGKTQRYDFKVNPENPRMGSNLKSVPADEFSSVRKIEDGYMAEFWIPFLTLAFDSDVIKNGFLLQIARNYRGIRKDSHNACLHLFPVYIYGDNRFGNSNHDQRAFKPVSIKECKK